MRSEGDKIDFCVSFQYTAAIGILRKPFIFPFEIGSFSSFHSIKPHWKINFNGGQMCQMPQHTFKTARYITIFFLFLFHFFTWNAIGYRFSRAQFRPESNAECNFSCRMHKIGTMFATINECDRERVCVCVALNQYGKFVNELFSTWKIPDRFDSNWNYLC